MAWLAMTVFQEIVEIQRKLQMYQDGESIAHLINGLAWQTLCNEST
jgi:hypothetical protein